jgi:hypothetical protein
LAIHRAALRTELFNELVSIAPLPGFTTASTEVSPALEIDAMSTLTVAPTKPLSLADVRKQQRAKVGVPAVDTTAAQPVASTKPLSLAELRKQQRAKMNVSSAQPEVAADSVDQTMDVIQKLPSPPPRVSAKFEIRSAIAAAQAQVEPESHSEAPSFSSFIPAAATFVDASSVLETQSELVESRCFSVREIDDSLADSTFEAELTLPAAAFERSSPIPVVSSLARSVVSSPLAEPKFESRLNSSDVEMPDFSASALDGASAPFSSPAASVLRDSVNMQSSVDHVKPALRVSTRASPNVDAPSIFDMTPMNYQYVFKCRTLDLAENGCE